MALRISSLPVKEQALLTLGCCFLVALASDRLVVSPMINRLARLDSAYAVDNAQLKSHIQFLHLEDSVASAYAAVHDRIGRSGAASEEIETMKGDLDELARRAGISLRAMQHLNPVRTDFLVSYTIEVSEFAGEIVHLLAFLRDLHAFPGMLRVSQLRVAADTGETTVTGAMQVTKVMTVADEHAGN